MKKKSLTFSTAALRSTLAKIRSVSSFIADRKGATAIEFAMIAMPFLGLIGAVLETGLVYFQTAQLQMTTEYASRSVLVGTMPAGLTYQQFVNQYICTWQTTGTVSPYTLSKMFDCSKVRVDISVPTSWNNSNTANNFYAAANPSATILLPPSGQIGVVRIAYPVPAFIAVLTGGVFTGQTINHTTTGQTTVNGAATYIIMGIYAFKAE
jgi:Flp pilus assembly protein TadG